MERKKKLKIFQLSLIIVGTLIIFFTYVDREKEKAENLISKENQEKIQKLILEDEDKKDTFYNIEYSGLDLAGNRYILKSKEAFSEKEKQEIVFMRFVEATFYFKDNTVLKVWSDEGKYNNKTLDMSFNNNVKAFYEDSKLYSQKAEYSNSKSFLEVSEDVKVIDAKGPLLADKLLFDIKNQTLNIASFNDSKINANIKIK